jgi:hypothetical protein
MLPLRCCAGRAWKSSQSHDKRCCATDCQSAPFALSSSSNLCLAYLLIVIELQHALAGLCLAAGWAYSRLTAAKIITAPHV